MDAQTDRNVAAPRLLDLLDGDRDVQHLVCGDEPRHVMAHGGERQDAGCRAAEKQGRLQ